MFVQFRPEDGKHRFDWRGGTYGVTLRGWLNRASRKRKPQMTTRFHFFVSAMDAVEFRDTFHHDPTVKAFPVVEWQREEPRDPLAQVLSGGA